MTLTPAQTAARESLASVTPAPYEPFGYTPAEQAWIGNGGTISHSRW
jgi:hypothetical protein